MNQRAGAAMGVIVVVVLLVVIASVAASLMGFGSARGDSQYTGVVVDVEEDRGVLFRTSQVHVRTDARASETETFCVHPDNQGQQIPTLREALSDQRRVTVTYSRPYVVPIWQCEDGLSIVRDVEAHNGTRGGAT